MGENWRDSKHLLLPLLILTFVPFYEGLVMIEEYGHFAGGDPEYHQKLAESWLNNQNPLFNRGYYLNGVPYPPAFSLTIAAMSKIFFTSTLSVMNFLQVVLFPLILISTFCMVYRKTNVYTSVISVIFLSSSFGFWDRAAQVAPQAMDVLLFPVIILLYMDRKSKSFILICTYLIYSHGLFALLLISSLLGYSLCFEKSKLKLFLLIFVLCIPLFLIYLVGTVDFSSVTNLERGYSPQTRAFLGNPFWGVWYLSYFLFSFSLFVLLKLTYTGFSNMTEFEKILVFWTAFLTPIILFLPERFVTYVAQPLSILTGVVMYGVLKTDRKRILFLGIGFVIALVYELSFYSGIGLFESNFIRSVSLILRYYPF